MRDAPKNASLNVATHLPITKGREYIFAKKVFPLIWVVFRCVAS